MSTSRLSGILLHPTSFPGRFGIGDLGQEAYQFIDFLQKSGQQLWQVLPLGPVAYGNSPYMCYSSMAGNPLLISLESLCEQSLLEPQALEQYPDLSGGDIDYERVIQLKLPLLLQAAETFRTQATVEQRQAFETFCASRAFWLNDYAFFMAAKEAHGGLSWHEWESELAKRDPSALDAWHTKLSSQIFHHKFLQYEFFRQWSELKTYANDFNIQIIGDIPIYVAHDSADVWAFPDLFCLDDETGQPSLVAGVPPDYFSETGQLWGNPIYNWAVLKETNFEWWIQRFRAMLDYVDLIRIDHFRGFSAYWAVAGGETTAVNGEWVEGPGEYFFEVLRDELGRLPILAEDLGVITPDVEALRDRFGFPGMKILQFAFGSDTDNPFLPFNFVRNCVVYTGTHDNDTTLGWYSTLEEYERNTLHAYLGGMERDGIHWALIRVALSSVAHLTITPLQDVLGLGTEARMNYPGKPSGNWAWRYAPDVLIQELGEHLRSLTTLYGRAPKKGGNH